MATRFSLSGLLGVVTLLAVTLGLARVLGILALVVPATCCFAAWFGRLLPAACRRHFVFCAAFLGACATAHAFACVASYETLGAVLSGMYYLALVLYTLPFALCAVGEFRPAVTVALILLIAFVPLQVKWFLHLKQCEREVTRIIAFANDYKRSAGSYPMDLSAYTPASPQVLSSIEYNNSNDHVMVYYWAAIRNAPHWYSVTSGWGYYDD